MRRVLPILLLLACGPGEPDLCDDDGYLSEGAGDLSFERDGRTWSSCDAEALVGGDGDHVAVRVRAEAETGDDHPVGWRLDVVTAWSVDDGQPEVCTEASGDADCMLELWLTDRGVPSCIYRGHSPQPDSDAVGTVEIVLEEVGPEVVRGTFSGVLEAGEALCGDEPAEELLSGTFEAPVVSP